MDSNVFQEKAAFMRLPLGSVVENLRSKSQALLEHMGAKSFSSSALGANVLNQPRESRKAGSVYLTLRSNTSRETIVNASP